MPDAITAYPLTWPPTQRRTPAHERKRAPFGAKAPGTIGTSRLTIAQALDRLLGELRRLGAAKVVISSNLRVRQDGLPFADQRQPEDPGVAVYFALGGQPRCLPCDRWDRVADNLAAVAAHIEATRAIGRYGVGTLDQLYTGFPALPATTARPWREVLGVSPIADLATAEAAYRALARAHHPDRGGSHDAMAELTRAITEARRELGAATVTP